MGSYTEIYARGTLRSDITPAESNALNVIAGDLAYTDDLELPDHPFFKTDRWSVVGSHTSIQFPTAGQSRIAGDEWIDDIYIHIVGQIKSYSHEAELFFDWIPTVLQEHLGEFIGYSLYEDHVFESDGGPKLYYAPPKVPAS